MTTGAAQGFGLEPAALPQNEPVAKALAVMGHAFKQGGETAQETLRIQNKALGQALEQNSALVDHVVKMANLVQESAKQSAMVAKVAADRDVELAKVKADSEFYGKLESLATGPIGQQILGRFFSGAIPPETKKALGNVLTRFLAYEEVCSAVQAENAKEYDTFLEFAKTLV